MGSDQTVARSGRARGEVVELLPAAAYKVRLEDNSVVTAHAAKAAEVNFFRLRVADKVEVELAPRDRTRGRVVKKLD